MRTKSKIEPCPTEYEEQVAVCSWARGYAAISGDDRLLLLHGDSSGVRVPIGCAMKMKRSGSVKGWPDLFLPVPQQNGKIFYFGLFIELKRRAGGVVSTEQKQIHAILAQNGYRVEVCLGAEEAIKTIKEYLGIK